MRVRMVDIILIKLVLSSEGTESCFCNVLMIADLKMTDNIFEDQNC